MKFRRGKTVKSNRQNKRILAVIAGLLVVLLIASAVVVRKTYQDNLLPVGGSTAGETFTVEPGSSVAIIADTLKAKGLVRSDWAFEWYVRNKGLNDDIKAGTYLLNPSMSVSDIVNVLIEGRIATDLVTILPGQRLDQVKAGLVKAGFDAAAIDQALDPAQYKDHPALSDKPADATLEGYLYPESFQKTADTKVADIISLSLDEMALHLTPEVRQAFSKQGLTLHQGVTLASIVLQEVGQNSSEDQPQVAQVFLKRYKIGMQLGSDVTAFYAAAVNGKDKNVVGVGFDSPYNTRLHSGLPPGPIGNVTDSAIKAVAFPAQTDWLYFVAGDDGNTYFSKTLAEHEALTAQHCTKLCN